MFFRFIFPISYPPLYLILSFGYLGTLVFFVILFNKLACTILVLCIGISFASTLLANVLKVVVVVGVSTIGLSGTLFSSSSDQLGSVGCQ